MPSLSKSIEATCTDTELADFGVPLPNNVIIYGATVKVKYNAGDVARCPAMLFLKTPDLGDSTVNHILAEGTIFCTTRGTRAPIVISESVYWSGRIPIPEIGAVSMRAAVNNETGADFTAVLSVIYDDQ